MEEEKKDLIATLASTGGDDAYLAAMLERVAQTPNFKIDRVLGKFVILEFLVYLNQHECFERLWSLSFRGRCYLIKNFRFILNRLLRDLKEYHLDFTKEDQLVSSFQYLKDYRLTPNGRINVHVPSIDEFNKICEGVTKKVNIHRLNLDFNNIYSSRWVQVKQLKMEGIEKFYANLEATGVRVLYINQCVDFEKLDFSKMKKVKEVIITNAN